MERQLRADRFARRLTDGKVGKGEITADGQVVLIISKLLKLRNVARRKMPTMTNSYGSWATFVVEPIAVTKYAFRRFDRRHSTSCKHEMFPR